MAVLDNPGEFTGGGGLPRKLHRIREQAVLPSAPAPLVSLVDDIDLRKMGRSIWRWRGLVLSSVVVFGIGSAIYVQTATPLYTATGQIAIGPRQNQVVNIQDVVSSLKGDNETIATEMGVIRSRKLAEKTLTKLALYDTPEFDPPTGLFSRVKTSAVEFLTAHSVLPPTVLDKMRIAQADGNAPDKKLNRAIDFFLDKLKVSSDGKSRILTVSFQSSSADTAAQVVNTLSDFYIVAQLDAKFEATKRANDWLSERLTSLKQELLTADSAVERYRRDHGIVQGQTSTLMTQEMSAVSADLTAARAKRIEAQSRLASVQRSDLARGRLDADLSSQPEVLQSPLISRLREAESDAARRAADLQTQYGDKHPKVINVKAELAEIHSKIQTEVGKVIEGLRSDVVAQQARESSLNATLEKLKGDAGKANLAEVEMRDLERTADANRTLYQNFLQRFKETQSQQDFQQADADIVSAAAVPNDPSFPQKIVIILLSLITGGIIGVLLALLWENMDVGIRSMEQIKNLLKSNPLGLIPQTGALTSRSSPSQDIVGKPMSAYAESIRTVHANLMLTDIDGPSKTVLVTSSLPGEGKSTTVASLAHIMALSGQKVVVVDCDLRRPKLHKLWNAPERPGLVDWLVHPGNLDEVIYRDHPSGAHLIAAGNVPSTPPNLLGSHRFQMMLRGLAEKYDTILIDSAPVMAVADTRVLAALADKTVFVVHWAKTPRKVAATALEQLQAGGADIAGAILTRVDVKAHAKDKFSDSILYTRELRAYYR
ncbi:MAG TPA: polysaccharide biosynthesis tyrosine autokinase [Stellaceae bacterium]|jgi:capsular exopolysaccharide synthesis family protein